MTTTGARIWLVRVCLFLYFASAGFFALAPALGYPLSYPDSINNLKIVIPVLLGQLGVAIHFEFARVSHRENTQFENINAIATTLITWPPILFAILMGIVLFGFAWSNQGLYSGHGMTPSILSLFVSILTGLLSGTTGIVYSYLFARRGRR